MKQIPGRKKMTLIALTLALGTAVYLNWEYTKNDANQLLATGTTLSDTQVITVYEEAQPTAAGEPEETGNKNYGDAQLVSLTADAGSEYFDRAKLERTKSRDEVLDKLQKSLKSAKLSDTEKKDLTDQLAAVLTSITAESEIENILKAKGFADCVVYLDENKANVTVMTGSGELSAAQVAQVRDAVIAKSDTDAKNITVVEVK